MLHAKTESLAAGGRGIDDHRSLSLTLDMKTPLVLLLSLIALVCHAASTPRSVATVANLSTLTPSVTAELVVVRNDHSIYVANSVSTGDWSLAVGSRGLTGNTGAQGPQGPPGPVPRSFANDAALLASTPRFVGELATLQDNHSIFVATAATLAAWTKAAGDPGPTGSPGPTGPPGATWRTGSGVPSNGLGADNDLYLRTDTGQVYKKTSGAYSSIADITGPDGPPGAFEDGQILYSSTHVPFIDPTTRVIYDTNGSTSAINCGTENQVVLNGFSAYVSDGIFYTDQIAVNTISPFSASRYAITLSNTETKINYPNDTDAAIFDLDHSVGRLTIKALPGDDPSTTDQIWNNFGALNIHGGF